MLFLPKALVHRSKVLIQKDIRSNTIHEECIQEVIYKSSITKVRQSLGQLSNALCHKPNHILVVAHNVFCHTCKTILRQSTGKKQAPMWTKLLAALRSKVYRTYQTRWLINMLKSMSGNVLLPNSCLQIANK